MKGKINASHLSLLQHTTQGWGKNYIVNGKSWSLFNFLALLFQPESLFQLKNSEEKCPLSWQGIIFQLLLISSLVSQIVLAKFFLQMMDWLFDCLFYIDNVDLLGENCQPATDGFIMLRHDINMNYDMPLIPVNQHCFNSVSRLPYIRQSLQGRRFSMRIFKISIADGCEDSFGNRSYVIYIVLSVISMMNEWPKWGFHQVFELICYLILSEMIINCKICSYHPKSVPTKMSEAHKTQFIWGHKL